VYLLVDFGFNPPPLNFYEASRFILPHRMDASDRHNGQREKRTIERTDGRTDGRTERHLFVHPSVRSFVHLLEFDTYQNVGINVRR